MAYHAKFINSHGQKPSLTLVTPVMLSMSLAKIYPLLIIADAALDNLMWICEDPNLPFLYVVLTYLSLSLYSWSWEYPVAGSQMANIILLWLELSSGVFLLFAASYFISSVYYNISTSEPPTVDDIILNLESLLDKLETLRNEIMFRRWFKKPISKVKMLQIFVRLVLVLTPVHYVLMKVITVHNYSKFLILFALFYHSDWMQVVLRLCWRLLIVRRFYFRVFNYIFGDEYTLLGNNSKFGLKTLNLQHIMHLTSNWYLQIPLPLNAVTKMKENHLLEILLLRYLNKNSKALENDDNIIKEFDSKTTADVVPKENTTDESATTSYNSSKVKIKEIVVFENQRKWKYKGWISKMLPYERPQFTTNCNNKYNDPGAYITESPEQLDLQVPPDWSWIEKEWTVSSWVYSDTDWNVTGTMDSLEGYTRSRIWKRKMFTL
ncbi:Integral peroxisomal membrane peroxin [Nakaseomyces glabratus]|nr:Integral peroxisomal membrane peroxin [Nakaseomyces glabratus]